MSSYRLYINIQFFIGYLFTSGASQETLSQSVGSSRANSLPRPMSPSPSVASDKNNGGDLHVSMPENNLY